MVTKRLPCRGCTTACGLLDHCGSTPWRLGQSGEKSGRSVTIYGGNGFVGTAIAKELAKNRFRVKCVSRSGAKPAHLQNCDEHWLGHISWLKGDAANPDHRLLAETDIVITTVGSPPVPTLSKAAFERQYDANGTANINLLEACSQFAIKQVLIVSAQIPAFLQKEGFAYAKGKKDAISTANLLFSHSKNNSKASVTIYQPSVIYGTRHTATGKRISLEFLRYVSLIIQKAAGRSEDGLLTGLKKLAPVHVSKIAAHCVRVCTKPEKTSSIKFVGNAELL